MADDGIVMRVAVLLVYVALVPGCYVFDEVEAAQRELEHRSPVAAREAREDGDGSKRASAAGASSPGWWEKARVLTREQRDESIVQCHLRGSRRFMGRDDCLSQGGSLRTPQR